MKKVILTLFLVCMIGIARSQTIKNIQASQDGDKIQIVYDLENAEAKDFFIRAYASSDGGKTFNIGVSDASGDVNRFVKPGIQHKIVWNAMNELGEFQGSMRFKIIGLSNTALGKSENKDFILGVMDAKRQDKDKILVSVSLFCKSPVAAMFSDKSFVVDNYGNSYKLSSGIVGGQSISNKQNFAANSQTYGDLIFSMSKVNPTYAGGAPTEFQIRLIYEDGAALYIAKVVMANQ